VFPGLREVNVYLGWFGPLARPAQIGGLADQGRPLAVGEPATFTLVDPDGIWTVRGAALASRSTNTPYEGMRLPATVAATVLRGRVTARDGKVVA
jgi:dihydroorotase